jgi:acyl-CoA thioesterase
MINTNGPISIHWCLEMDLSTLDLPEVIRERLRAIDRAPFAIPMGMELLSISDAGEVIISMDVSDKLNALGGAHGGAIFTLADQAFAIACNLGEHTQVAICASINYIRPAKGKVLAVTRKVAETKQTSVHEVRVLENGELVALFQGTGYKLRRGSHEPVERHAL